MRILKRILMVLIGLIAVLLIVALFIPEQIVVIRKITIHRNQIEVFDYVKHLKNQEKYGVWWKADPNMKITTSGIDGTVGYIHAWKSTDDNVGEGQQKIISLHEDSTSGKMEIELKFIKPFKSNNPSYISTASKSKKSTIVTWAITSHMPYPMNLLGAVINMEKMLGDDLDQGLKNLKVILEK
jgi:ribosomal protein S8